MVQISYYVAMVIFQLYQDRFSGMKSVSEMTQYGEILLPHGVKLTKVDRRYYIKYYSQIGSDWSDFCRDMFIEFFKLRDTNRLPQSAENVLIQRQIHEVLSELRSRAGVHINPDGSASFTGELVGMGF